jgi:hypothetical protein
MPAHPAAAPPQPSMADVWNELPAGTGMLAEEIRQRIQAHAPLVPVHVASAASDEPRMRPRPYEDPIEWLLLKHGIQLAFVASVVLFVVYGGRAPLLALGYVGTGFMLMGVLAVADRLRFLDRDPSFEIVEILAPEPAPQVHPQHVLRPAPLAPLVEQMQVALPEPVAVT